MGQGIVEVMLLGDRCARVAGITVRSRLECGLSVGVRGVRAVRDALAMNRQQGPGVILALVDRWQGWDRVLGVSPTQHAHLARFSITDG
jgi:hypothetical protein